MVPKFTDTMARFFTPKLPRRLCVPPEIELAERVIAHCDDDRYLANDIADIKELAKKILENAKVKP